MPMKGLASPSPGKAEKLFGYLKVEAGCKLEASGQATSHYVTVVEAFTSLVSLVSLGSWHSCCCPRGLVPKLFSCRTSPQV